MKRQYTHAAQQREAWCDVPCDVWLEHIVTRLDPAMHAALYCVSHSMRALVPSAALMQPQRMAARCGHLALVEWYCGPNAPWSVLVNDAARGGHLPLVQHAVEQGALMTRYTLRRAVASGDVSLVMWIHARGVPLDAVAAERAVKHGHLAVFAWLGVRCSYYPSQCMEMAVRHGRVVFMESIDAGHPIENHVFYNHYCCTAASNNQLGALKWLRAHGAPWGAVIEGALSHERVLEWVSDNGYCFDVIQMIRLIKNGYVALAQRLIVAHNFSAPCLTRAAAGRGDRPLLEWLRARDCPWDWSCYEAAQKAGHYDLVRWLFAQRCPVNYLPGP